MGIFNFKKLDYSKSNAHTEMLKTILKIYICKEHIFTCLLKYWVEFYHLLYKSFDVK